MEGGNRNGEMFQALGDRPAVDVYKMYVKFLVTCQQFVVYMETIFHSTVYKIVRRISLREQMTNRRSGNCTVRPSHVLSIYF